ncbi:hypothetical protein DW107_09495 [Tannerella sp. AM09-19]|nr:hypothetical protein DW107_09495 [Tannerella sp. AM09-19]
MTRDCTKIRMLFNMFFNMSVLNTFIFLIYKDCCLINRLEYKAGIIAKGVHDRSTPFIYSNIF